MQLTLVTHKGCNWFKPSEACKLHAMTKTLIPFFLQVKHHAGYEYYIRNKCGRGIDVREIKYEAIKKVICTIGV
jgi:hypothetical protein